MSQQKSNLSKDRQAIEKSQMKIIDPKIIINENFKYLLYLRLNGQSGLIYRLTDTFQPKVQRKKELEKK